MSVLEGREELFLLKDDGDRYILYAPLRRVAAVVNGAAAQLVSRYGTNPVECPDNDLINELVKAGLFSQDIPERPVYPQNLEFMPYMVTLFLTSRCNLRCIYCYAEAGTRFVDMPWDVAKAAMDFVIGNALSTKRKDFSIAFHGGGEPTLAWSMMQRCTEYALDKGREHSMKASVHTASNGILNAAQREYIIRNFAGINISFDGLEYIQNKQRPFMDGSGSHGAVMETMRHFESEKFNYGVRLTITDYSVKYLVETVEFLCGEFPTLRQIHAEPMWYCGRCHSSLEQPPDDEVYVREFLIAADIAKKAGRELYYSGARFESLTNRFCAAPGTGFAVMPEGIASSCFEVTDPQDPRSEIFHYGRYQESEGRFVFDEEKIRRLRSLTVDNITHCSDCFCKWHCAGDCLAKVLKTGNPDAHHGSKRCNINRELTKRQIIGMIDNASEEQQNSTHPS